MENCAVSFNLAININLVIISSHNIVISVYLVITTKGLRGILILNLLLNPISKSLDIVDFNLATNINSRVDIELATTAATIVIIDKDITIIYSNSLQLISFNSV